MGGVLRDCDYNVMYLVHVMCYNAIKESGGIGRLTEETKIPE